MTPAWLFIPRLNSPRIGFGHLKNVLSEIGVEPEEVDTVLMSVWMGFFLIVIGGIMQGSYFLGLKYVHPWKWENIWSLYAFCGLLLLPVGLAIATVPRLGEVMRLAPRNDVFHIFVYGAGWGIGSVLAGLGVVRVGM